MNTRRNDARSLRDCACVMRDNGARIDNKHRQIIAKTLDEVAQRIDAVEDAIATLLNGHIDP